MSYIISKKIDKNIKVDLDTGTLFLELLFLLFLGLKLGNVIDWSWWWVFAPLWVPIALAAVIVVLLLLGAGLLAIVRGITKK